MVIIGAKGFAKEILEIFDQLNQLENLVFFDNVSNDLPNYLFERFPVLKSEIEIRDYFHENGNTFTLGVGNPKVRKSLGELVKKWGGEMESVVSPFARIGSFDNIIGKGSSIMTGTVMTNNIFVGEGCLINLNCTIGHDSYIGSYSELSPGVHISGNVKIGESCFIGTGAVVLPGIQIGDNCVIGAGTLVTKNVTNNMKVIGVPGISKHL
ncbi:MAG: acetyltransferase [Crocinitomicaceae bacterium]|jgi:sugar O-acyltransferase (sialic acid O-acetyltransferase NeuD family)